MAHTAKSIYLYARTRAGRGWGVRGEGETMWYAGAMEIWKHDTEGHYTAAYATNLDTFKIAHFVADTPNLAELYSYLGIGQGLHREEPVGIHIRPGQITFTSGSIHKHEIRCDTTDFEAVAEALRAGIRWHIRRNML